MPKCIAAVFGSAQNLLQGLFRTPRGRHSTRRNTTTRRSPGGRIFSTERRRSRRIRRYAPALPAQSARVPAQSARVPAQPTAFHERPRRDQRTTAARPATGRPSAQTPSISERATLAPSTAPFPADDVALVRPYFSAHERAVERDRNRERNRLRERARARHEGDHRQRIATDRLTAWGADTRALVTLAVPSPPARGPRVPAARGPEPAPTPHVSTARMPSRLDHLPHLSRLRRQQQQRRAQEVATV